MSFKHLSPAERSLIAAKGGRRSQELGKGHRWDAIDAALAGMKGGRKTSQDREHMKRIGAMGGNARAKNAKPMEPK